MIELRDPVSSLSHLLTAIWAVFATALMYRLAPQPSRTVAMIYGMSMVLLYTASGLFHGLYYESTAQHRLFQKLDQSAIYLLIAGTNTPIMAILLPRRWRRWFLGGVWLMACLGIASLWALPKPPHTLVVGVYLAMGWIGIIPIRWYYQALGARAMNWAWLGAACYTFGAVCELSRWPVLIPGWIGPHEVLHFCDSAGSLAFFVFIVRHVLLRPGASPGGISGKYPVLPTHFISQNRLC
ncbi:MAG: hemolysin III family protein [Gemmataceae bacterium]|nr:hemolysin III family protein [Gemmataceae bacterium]